MKRFQSMFAIAFFITLFSGAHAIAQTVPAPQVTEQANISDQELTKFANAYMGLQQIGMEANELMTDAIAKEGMEVTRFNEIHQAALDPSKESDATEAEMKKHEAIVAKLEGMSGDIQAKMEKKIKEEGLTLQRYETIVNAMRADKDLVARLQAKMEANGNG
tara:strand:- start:6883 stop:7368 length:486 start_codon:yes stop_codon:yes gene_type:complete